jgi:hypothetical protein
METSEPGATRATGTPTRRNTTPPIGHHRCIPITPPLSADPGQSAFSCTSRPAHLWNPGIAGKILGHIGDVTRFPTADHLASYTGTSPLEASSGDRRRHRLNTTGNRRLNTAIHTVAVCQARDPGPGRIYYLRKIAEGKTPAEARRALKRRLTNVLYRHILKDQQRRPDATT